MIYLAQTGVRTYPAQADMLTAFGQWQPWHIAGAIVLCIAAVFVLRELSVFFFRRGEFVREKADSNIAEMAMKANQDLTKQWTDTVHINRETKDQLANLSEIIRQQHEQAANATKAIEALASRIEASNKGQEMMVDKIQASLLVAEGSIEVMSAIKENTEAFAIKLEADTATTQQLIAESAERTIKATGERLTELDTVIKALPESFCQGIKEALSVDLRAIETTLNSIMARLDAQKVERNETPFTPTVDLPVMPDGKSGNGTGDTTAHPDD